MVPSQPWGQGLLFPSTAPTVPSDGSMTVIFVSSCLVGLVLLHVGRDSPSFFNHLGIFPFLAFNFDYMFMISVLGESCFSPDLICQDNIQQKFL